MGLFSKIKEGLKKTRKAVMGQIDSMLKSFTKIDEELFEELEELLVMGDVGMYTAEKICDELKKRVKEEGITDPSEIRRLLEEVVTGMLSGGQELDISTKPSVILVIGVNGVGKTTTIGKLAAKTGEDFNKVSLENPKLIETINMEICKTRFHCEPYYPAPQTPLELARVYAYAMCAADSKDHFERVKDYVFRDDIYRELAKNKDLVIDEIMSLIRNWSKGDEKANDIRLLYEYDIDKKVIAVYRELYNQWDAADCLARVNAMILLKHYQN